MNYKFVLLILFMWNAVLISAQRPGRNSNVDIFATSPSKNNAADKKESKSDKIPEVTTSTSALIPPPAEAKHTQVIGGKQIAYTTYTGYMQLKKEDGTPMGNVFFVAYIKDGENRKTRPLTFAFNGGPGSASVWVHMGFLGPKRPLLDEFGNAEPPPYGYEDNPDSWLDLTDLIFIDPVSTGYSRPVDGQSPSQFHGYVEDIQSVGEFMRLFLTRYNRWASPKYILGESYGTPRAAGLSKYMQDRYNVYFNGIILLSSILNFQTARFDIGNDLPYPLFLPTYATTAWYHKKLAPELQNKKLNDFIAEVEKFDVEQYEPALMQGSDLPATEYDNLCSKLSYYTGLSKDYIKETNLRINIQQFCKELERKDGFTVGRLDSRYTGRDYEDVGDRPEFDPTGKTAGAFSAAWNDYVQNDLKYKNELAYDVSGRVAPWNYNNVQNRYLNTAEELRGAMAKNPDMKVWVACGYFDLATPFYAAEYTFKHMNLRPEQQKNLHFTYYESGHMVYMYHPALKQFKQDAEKMYRSAN